MTRRRASTDPGQLGFTFEPPQPARGAAALAGLDKVISAMVARALKEDDRPDRYAVAAEMSSRLGETVTKAMLDKYAGEAGDTHNISFHRALALVAVTDRFDLLDELLRRIGAALLVGEEIITAELGHIDRSIAKLKQRRRAIERAAPVITAGRKQA